MKRWINLLVRRECPKGRISLTPNEQEMIKMTVITWDLQVNVDLKLLQEHDIPHIHKV
jgi:hypothetical protein